MSGKMDFSHVQVGARVKVSSRGSGILTMDNDDGTWNVEFDDGTEADLPIEQMLPDLPDPTECSGIRVVPQSQWADSKPEGWTRFVCFSDTHGLHDKIPAAHRPAGDVLLHAGDFTNTGELEQVQSFSTWLANYPCTTKLVIAGNHDTTFDEKYYHREGGGAERFHRRHPYDCSQARSMLVGPGGTLTESGGAIGPCCIYLEDECTDVHGYRIYGSPWQPEFCDWAFNLARGEECAARWDTIPTTGVDILITHGPPYGIGDKCSNGTRAGCHDLKKAIDARQIAAHISGHIHEGYGVEASDGTLFINASTCTHRYEANNPPVVIDVPPPNELRAAKAGAASAT